jgi:peptidyl-prolyl cis-trans isomerase A (cyclophilin A)
MNASITAWKTLAAKTLTGSFLILLLAGFLFAPTRARAQAQAAGAVAPVRPTGGGPAGQGTSAKTPGNTAKKSPATARPAYDRALLHPALLKDKAPDQYKVKFSSTRGDFVVTVTRSWAPLGADRFYNLVKHHFFDNASFFRVLPDFVAQFGISAYPAVSTVWANANIKDEPVVQGNKKGYLAFAKTGAPNTRSTQLFINLKDNSQSLDPQGFSAFGVVDDPGMKVVEMLYDGYGNSGPDQGRLTAEGKPYVDKNFPKIDTVKSATITEPAAAAVGSKPASAAKPATTTKKPQ